MTAPTLTAASLPAASSTAKQSAVVFDSRSLFAAGREIAIRHDGQLYRLCLTRHNRLILVK